MSYSYVTYPPYHTGKVFESNCHIPHCCIKWNKYAAEISWIELYLAMDLYSVELFLIELFLVFIFFFHSFSFFTFSILVHFRMLVLSYNVKVKRSWESFGFNIPCYRCRNWVSWKWRTSLRFINSVAVNP